MNFKKLISVSFSTLGIACAISACSGDKVAGADEQPNTVATNSSSFMESSSSSAQKPSELDKAAIKATMAMKAIFMENDDAPMFVLIADTAGKEMETTKETDNPKASFDEFVQSVTSNDSVMWLDPLLGQFSCDSTGCLNYTAALKDETKVTHGPLVGTASEIYKSAGCNLMDESTYERKVPFWYYLIFDDGYVFKHFYKDAADYGEDFPTLEQFKKECAAEGGEILMEGFDSFAYADTSARCTITFAEHNDCDEKTGRCERVAPPEDTLIVYKDPYWKKYIMALVDNCKLELEP